MQQQPQILPKPTFPIPSTQVEYIVMDELQPEGEYEEYADIHPPQGSQGSNVPYNRPGGLSTSDTAQGLSLTKREFDTQRNLTKDSSQLLREDAILRQWLAGDTLQQIMSTTGFSWGTVVTYIKKGRQNLKEVMDDDLSNLAVERVEAFRDIKRRAIVLTEIQPRLAPQLLKVAIDAEVNIGKIQGVLNEKVLHIGKIQHEHKKMYDFVDTLPPAPGEGVTAPALEASYKVLDEPLADESTSPVEEYHTRAYAATPAQSDLRRGERSYAQQHPRQHPTSTEYVVG